MYMILLCLGTKVAAYVDNQRTGTFSIYHANCEQLVEYGCKSKRCLPCTKHRKSLCAMVSRPHKDKGTDHSSHTTYSALHTPEREERFRSMQKENKRLKLMLERLQQRISDVSDVCGVVVDDDLHRDLKTIVGENSEQVHAMYPKGSFQRVFWDQQEKASSLRNAKAMRWHPLFVKWCLYLRHLSGKAYETLRQTGCVYLPSQRTLRDYTYFNSTTIGFSIQVDQQLLDVAKLENKLNQYVLLVLDEMYIKEELVYDKHEGELIGFSNLGNINNHLLKFEASLKSDSQDVQLAKSMLVLMVRGLFSKLNFPYAQFACAKLTGDLLLEPLWEAISRLERQGFKVLALTCDGASANRRLWTLHSEMKRKRKLKKQKENDDNEEEETDENDEDVLYKVPNVFATDANRPLYFIADPPHLLKTARNCWSSKSRHLWVILL